MSEHAITQAAHERAPVYVSGKPLAAIFGALMLAMLVSALDQTIVSTALPTIVGDLGGQSQLSWVVTGYILTSTVSTPLYGKIGDMVGRKGLFMLAIVIFLIGSALSGQAQNMSQLIGFRALQGLGAGGLMVGSQAIIGDVVPPRERGRYMGYFGGVFALATVAGPLIGGFFVDNLSWRWVFYVNVPIGIAALIVIALVLHLPRHRIEHRIDWVGAAVLSAGTTAIILMVTWGGTQYPWGSWQTFGLALLGLGFLGAWAVIEQHVPEPILALQFFKNRVFTVSSIVGFLVGFAMFGAIIFLPQYMQIVKGESATNSGLQLVPMMVGLLFASILSGQLISRTGKYKVWPILGTGIAVLAMALFATLQPQTSMLLVTLYMVILGIGFGCCMQVLVVAVQNAVQYRDLGAATSAATFFRSMGGAIGVAVFGSIFSNSLANTIPKALHSIPIPVLIANRKVLETLAGHNAASVSATPVFIDHLPSAIHTPFIAGYANSIDLVFWGAVPFMVIAFLFSWFLREIPLRERGGHLHMLEGVDEGFGSSTPSDPETTLPEGKPGAMTEA